MRLSDNPHKKGNATIYGACNRKLALQMGLPEALRANAIKKQTRFAPASAFYSSLPRIRVFSTLVVFDDLHCGHAGFNFFLPLLSLLAQRLARFENFFFRPCNPECEHIVIAEAPGFFHHLFPERIELFLIRREAHLP